MLKVIRFPLIIIWIGIAALWGVIVSLCRPFDTRNVKAMTNILRHGRKIMGVKIEMRNREIMDQNRPCVFVSNHQDNFDIFPGAFSLSDKTVSLGKRSLIYIPIFGQFYWLSGNILIDRKNKKSAFSTMDAASEAIKEKGISVWIMPEGTRSKGRGLLPFKKGPFITAIKSGQPIVPIAISNYVGKLDFNKWHAGKILIEVLPPISTVGKTIDDVNELKDKAFSMMSAAILRLDHEILNSRE